MNIVDVHTHVGKWMFPIQRADIDDLVAIERQCGISKCVISSSSAILYDFIEGNSLLARQLDKYRGLCYGYVVVNPHYLDESLNEIEKYSRDPRFVGVKLHPDQQAFSLKDRAVARIVDRAHEHRMPLLVHTFSAAAAAHLTELAGQHRDLPIIMAHMGGAEWESAVKYAEKAENIYLDPCCSYADRGKLEAAVRAVGAGRVVFGSDAVLFNPRFVIGMIESAEIEESDRQLIYRDNAMRIFGLEE
ncbi:MAG TPA: amidohydrolase [Firmicutes bacterium]|nr:amidohydrolase [Bacillota bacterium]